MRDWPAVLCPSSLRRSPRRLASSLIGCLLLLSAGCATTITPPAPSSKTKAVLPRPVIIIGGFVDPGLTATHVAGYIRQKTGEQRVLAVHPGYLWSFDDAADLVVSAVERHFPSDDPQQTIAVDVIGVSMGGLVARHAAAPGNGGKKRLNIQRLYTTATPHSGAQTADVFGYLGTALAMRTGSGFLKRLAKREQLSSEDDYPIVQYSRGTDLMIGGRGLVVPRHLKSERVHYPVPWYAPAHPFIYRDGRILRDMLRRLKETEPATQAPTSQAPTGQVGTRVLQQRLSARACT